MVREIRYVPYLLRVTRVLRSVRFGTGSTADRTKALQGRVPYCMELQLPSQAICPLCESHTVEVGSNTNDRPKVFCERFQTPINFRGSREDRAEFLTEYVEMVESDEPEPEETAETVEESDESPSQSIEDLIGGEDSE